MPQSAAVDPRIVSRAEWLEARTAHLAKEKALLRQVDALHREGRALPWVRVDTPYVFDTAAGPASLADLFDGRSQLIVRHFMMGPGWKEGCVGCSFGADHDDGIVVHLEHHDVSYVAVSRAPLAEIEAFRKRMGWRFRWVSSFGTTFNYDYQVSFTPEQVENGAVYNYTPQQVDVEELAGLSLFVRNDAGDVFHTYSTFARGTEMMSGVYGYLDHFPKGRNENGPHFTLADWVKHHDRYGSGDTVAGTGRVDACRCED